MINCDTYPSRAVYEEKKTTGGFWQEDKIFHKGKGITQHQIPQK